MPCPAGPFPALPRSALPYRATPCCENQEPCLALPGLARVSLASPRPENQRTSARLAVPHTARPSRGQRRLASKDLKTSPYPAGPCAALPCLTTPSGAAPFPARPRPVRWRPRPRRGSRYRPRACGWRSSTGRRRGTGPAPSERAAHPCPRGARSSRGPCDPRTCPRSCGP